MYIVVASTSGRYFAPLWPVDSLADFARKERYHRAAYPNDPQWEPVDAFETVDEALTVARQLNKLAGLR